ncbi:MAG: UDP-3-O-(3-hydroxymyristoyl)glucosamine N-acyltransferase [Hyphomonas sp.]|nr:UDP-3-O-(3-hydroxymyristoyl)glucosamine N-acyltransferase [Hyphomonas sp.]
MTVDPRFYAPLGALTLGQVAEMTGAPLDGDGELPVTGISSAGQAQPGDLVFLDGDGKSAPQVSPNAAIFVTNEANLRHVPEGAGRLVVRFPRYAHAIAALAMYRPRHLDWTGDARIAPDAQVHETARVSSGAVIGPGAVIGEGSWIGPNASIGPGVQIGRHCQIGANTSVFCALLGDHVTLLAGARIGESGFGVMAAPDGQRDAPHFGRVILQDHVTVGANTCIDRGVFEDTILGERTKIDNLCQIAHNVVFGRSVIMAAFGGISGSVRVGNQSMLGGRVGIADHVRVGEGVSLAASSGLFRNVEDGETWGGTPAKPLRQWMREVAWLQKQANPKKNS